MHIAYHSDLVIPELNRIAVVTLLDDVVLDMIPLNVGQQTTEIGISLFVISGIPSGPSSC